MSFEVYDVCDLYKEKAVFAKIEHDCGACGEKIKVGHLYVSIFIVYEGTAQYKRCVRCQAIHKHLRNLAPGDMWPMEDLSCGEDYEEEWGEKPPEEIQNLAFITQEEAQRDLARDL